MCHCLCGIREYNIIVMCVDVYLYLACMYVHVCVSYLPECKLQYNCFESTIEVCDLGSKCAHFTEWP